MNESTTNLIGRVVGGENLSMEQTSGAIDAIMRGQWSEEEIGLLLTGLATKGETVEEIAGAAQALRRHMTPIRSDHAVLLDTCGTGGGGSKTFNISTTAALVAAAAGVAVAKHGNRSITSNTGSADVLTELGVNINATVEQVEKCLAELGLCFCFAPMLHPAMKHVAPVRKKLGIRTIFNIIGPLSNPAGAKYQLLGAGRPELRPLLAGAMQLLGTKRTLVVSGEDGLGDVTIGGRTFVTAVEGDQVSEFEWTPEEFGVARGSLGELEVANPVESAAMIRKILTGEKGPGRDIVVLNAAAGLIAAGKSTNPKDASKQAAEALESGRAQSLLTRLAECSHR